jgi:hypothetical protein
MLALLEGVHFSDIVRVTVILAASAAIGLCAWLFSRSAAQLRSTHYVKLLHITLPAVSLYKLMGLFGMFLIPTFAVAVASYEVVEGNMEMHACVRCHVMRPMANDMTNPESETLAARHFRNRWIPEQQCYHCHTDYGFAGTIEAKMTGLRHLLRYTTRTYHEPIQLAVFNNANCMHCHGGTPKYVGEEMHDTAAAEIASNETSCTSCHGDAHPSRDSRTPGNADYDQLMRATELER